MPIQQAVDVAVPVKVAYNQWTQFEEWPRFMHRIESAEQVDDAKVAFTTKIWGIKKRFEAQIVEQHPDERIEWDVKEGVSHTGVATFHKLADRLTRIEVSIDVEPEGLVEKAGRGHAVHEEGGARGPAPLQGVRRAERGRRRRLAGNDRGRRCQAPHGPRRAQVVCARVELARQERLRAEEVVQVGSAQVMEQRK